ncbi:MAG TPA: hypothetical protein VLA75_12010 [Thermoanaerobaculia bacterium]|nr:hypothetical protein [Thermoanaerobaculia bacterium]
MSNEVYRNGKIVLELPTGLFWGLLLAALIGSWMPVLASEVLADRIEASRGVAAYFLRSLGWAATMLLWLPHMHALGVVIYGKQQEFPRRGISTGLLVAGTVTGAFAVSAVRLLFERLF